MYLLESAVRVAGRRVGEEDAALEVRSTLIVRVPHIVVRPVVHEEEDAAAGTIQVRPPVLEDGLLECQVSAPHIVGCDEFAGLKDGADLVIQVSEELLVVPLNDRCAEVSVGRLKLHHDGDGYALPVAIHPGLDDAKALDECDAHAVNICVRNVEDLGALVLPGRIFGVGKTGLLTDQGLGITAALRVGQDIDPAWPVRHSLPIYLSCGRG